MDLAEEEREEEHPDAVWKKLSPGEHAHLRYILAFCEAFTSSTQDFTRAHLGTLKNLLQRLGFQHRKVEVYEDLLPIAKEAAHRLTSSIVVKEGKRRFSTRILGLLQGAA